MQQADSNNYEISWASLKQLEQQGDLWRGECVAVPGVPPAAHRPETDMQGVQYG